jgi:hypothetical protein
MRVAVLLAFLSVFLISAFSCTFEAANNCSTGTKVLGVQNFSGGYNNSHAEVYSNTDYNNSVCCTLTGDTLMHSCGTTLLRLSNTTNAHVEQSNESHFAYAACVDGLNTNFTCSYTDGVCPGSQTCVLTIAGSIATGSNSTNAHVGDCTAYTRKLCCGTNTRPNVPTLIAPTNNNTTVFSRYPYFNWVSTDPDGDTITYFWNITSPPGCAVIPEKSMLSLMYTSTDRLCVDAVYNWTVKACDAQGCSAYAAPFNFTISSVIGITFQNASIDYGTFDPSTPTQQYTKNTSADAPPPLRYNNTGNVDMSVQVKANDAIWALQPLNTYYFQYADENTTNWQNWTASYASLLDNLSYPDGTRELEVLVRVPMNEPAGAKNTSVTALGASIE